MRVIVSGALGRMGSIVCSLLGEDAVGKIDISGETPDIYSFDGEADVIIDFSNHAGTERILKYAAEKKIPAVIATTGHTEEEKKKIFEASGKIPVFYSANMSIGIAKVCACARELAKAYPGADIEIVETHHKNKLDSPSGTALMIAEEIKKERGGEIVCGRSGHALRNSGEIGISSVRCGGIVGEHEVVICTENERITLKHEAFDRKIFALGAIEAAKYIIGKPAGLYNMKDM